MIGELIALVGAFLILLAAIGAVRFQDPLARMHALAKASTFGVLLVLAGLAFNLEEANDFTSVVLAGLLHLVTSPPASNMVSRATYLAREIPHGDEIIDEGAVPLGLHEPTGPLDDHVDPTERREDADGPQRPRG
jgi:multicomponent Na+:H+ antiporter subunit G